MRIPQTDYREFRLSKINEPRFSHLKLLSGWILYFILYFLTENLIPRENCHVIHCALDDIIPFCELFVIPYVLWYLLIIGSLLYFALYDVEDFKRLMKYIIITQIIAMAIYMIYPSCQNLRPAQMPRDNIFTRIIMLLYTIDTSTNVCPSLHVAYSIGIASVWLRRPETKTANKILVTLFALSICLSTVFIKQHSVVDGIAAIPVCIIAEIIVFALPKKRTLKAA